jgi:peptidylprolyl isomerase
MRLVTALLVPTFALAALAQTPAPAKPHPATHTAATASHTGCLKLPDLSPTLPKLPTDVPSAKALYTLSVPPTIKIEYASPLEGSALRDTLGIENATFSLGYIDTKIGTGALTEPHKWYSIQYTGYLIDGSKFDSSNDHPNHEAFSFQYGAHQVIAGWDTGFAGMHVGGKRRLFIPYQLAYGPTGHGAIPAKSMLIFDVELISQSEDKPAPPAPPAASYMHNPPQKSGAPAQPATQPATPPPATPQKR